MIVKRVIGLLLPSERVKGVKMIAGVVLSSLLDFVSVAMLVPILYLMLDGGYQEAALISFCAVALGVILVKAFVSTYIVRSQQRFLLGVYKRMSFSLLDAYFRRGLLFIRENGVSKLSYEVNFVCYSFGQNILLSLLNIAGDVLLSGMILLALLVYNWKIALLLLLSFIPLVILYLLAIRKQLVLSGRQELHARRRQGRIVSETFAGYAELQVNDAYTAKKKEFCEGMDVIAGSRMKMETLSKLPMMLSELAIIIGLVAIVLFGQTQIEALVGVFVVAAMRLLPSIRSIIVNWGHIQNAQSGLQVIEEGLTGDNESSCSEEIEFKSELALNDLSYSFEDNNPLIDRLNLSISKGEYVGLSGYSGIGKTTLFNLMLGFISPKSGEITVDGIPLTKTNSQAWLKKVGYVQQDVYIFNASLAENIALGADVLDRDKVVSVLKKVALWDWAQALPDGIDTVLGEFGGMVSGGQKQRIGIARALYKDAEIIFLDEATSALDDDTEKSIHDMLLEMRKGIKDLTIISIAHRKSSLKYCDRIIMMDEK